MGPPWVGATWVPYRSSPCRTSYWGYRSERSALYIYLPGSIWIWSTGIEYINLPGPIWIGSTGTFYWGYRKERSPFFGPVWIWSTVTQIDFWIWGTEG